MKPKKPLSEMEKDLRKLEELQPPEADDFYRECYRKYGFRWMSSRIAVKWFMENYQRVQDSATRSKR